MAIQNYSLIIERKYKQKGGIFFSDLSVIRRPHVVFLTRKNTAIHSSSSTKNFPSLEVLILCSDLLETMWLIYSLLPPVVASHQDLLSPYPTHSFPSTNYCNFHSYTQALIPTVLRYQYIVHHFQSLSHYIVSHDHYQCQWLPHEWLLR